MKIDFLRLQAQRTQNVQGVNKVQKNQSQSVDANGSFGGGSSLLDRLNSMDNKLESGGIAAHSKSTNGIKPGGVADHNTVTPGIKPGGVAEHNVSKKKLFES